MEQLAFLGKLSVPGTVGTASANQTHAPGTVARRTEREERETRTCLNN